MFTLERSILFGLCSEPITVYCIGVRSSTLFDFSISAVGILFSTHLRLVYSRNVSLSSVSGKLNAFCNFTLVYDKGKISRSAIKRISVFASIDMWLLLRGFLTSVPFEALTLI